MVITGVNWDVIQMVIRDVFARVIAVRIADVIAVVIAVVFLRVITVEIAVMLVLKILLFMGRWEDWGNRVCDCGCDRSYQQRMDEWVE
jgi:hypothetical protein